MAGRHCSTGTWVAQCTAEEMSRKNREKISLGAKSEQRIWNLGLTGQTAKAPKNEHTMQKRMCWDANHVTHLMASGHATVQMMHKTPSLWRRAKMPWIFGHAKQI